MKVRHTETNCRTGEVREWEEDVPDGKYLTVEQGKELDRLQAIRDANAAIIAQLDAIDAKAIRALMDGDAARIAEYNAQKAALRAQMRPVA